MIFASASIDQIVNNLVFSGIIVVLSIFLARILNSVISYKRRVSATVLWKSNLIALAISYGIWTGLTFILGLTIGVFVTMQDHILLVELFLIVNYFMGKKLTKDEISKSLSGLEERLKEKEMLLSPSEEKIGDDNVLLSVEDLITYFYTEEGIVKAVEGVTFQIYEDEVLGLVGETGCGKSVTALSVLQLIRPPGEIVGGKVLFQGIDLLNDPEVEMQKFRGNQITMIFQDPLNSLNPVMKVGDQIIEVFLNHKMDELYAEAGQDTQEIGLIRTDLELKKESIKELQKEIDTDKDEITKSDEDKYQGEVILEKTPDTETFAKIRQKEDDLTDRISDMEKTKKEFRELKDRSNVFAIADEWAANIIRDVGISDPEQILNRYPHELSGGMRQRVMIAIALSCSPKLLIADEPTTALDVTIQAQILELMKRLQKEYKTSILMITHDLGLISELCDRVAVMYSGYIVEYGSIYKLFKNPLHPYTHGLILAIPRVEKRVDNLMTIPGMVPNLIYPPSGCRFHPRCDYCFEPCDTINPEQIETEPGYFVACHLYDPKYKDLAKNVIENSGNPNKIKQEGN
ncbi:MAG: oligopeptide/dipeptide ABC transporter ATP-binding protein [Promethearchaeota archaeon]|jgi:peptide/nickel transport system ATP-binding protein